jgi:DNA-binding PadR family transcriptional regulator
MDGLSRAILHELASGGPLTAVQLAARLEARHWADLSTALGKLVSSGYISVTGPLGRAETTYRIHERGRAALGR